MTPVTTATASEDRQRLTIQAPRIAEQTLDQLTDMFDLLSDRSRLKLLLTLARNDELNVSALCRLLGQTQPAVSHHLKQLRIKGLVEFRREGKHNYYRLHSGPLRDLLERVGHDTGHAQHRLPFDDLVFKLKPK
jgi:DNA-binding transcriptional ArsR family regulator